MRPPMPIQILRRGSKGTDVKKWQNFLIGRRYLKGGADGDFGSQTRARR